MNVSFIGIASQIRAMKYLSILLHEQIDVIGIYDHNKKKGQSFSNRYAIPFFENLSELLALESDMVIICSETTYHYRYTLLAARAKKHIFLEKPMALNTSEAKDMIQVCSEENVKLMIAHPMRFSKSIQDFKKRLQKKDFGKLLSINATFHGMSSESWHSDCNYSGGGALMDAAPVLDLVHYLFNLHFESVFTFTNQFEQNINVEDTALLQLQFKEGVLMNLNVDWRQSPKSIYTENTILELLFENGCLFLESAGQKFNLYTPKKIQSKKLYNTDNNDGLMLKSFINSVLNDTPPLISGEDGLYTLTGIEMAFQSIHQNENLLF